MLRRRRGDGGKPGGIVEGPPAQAQLPDLAGGKAWHLQCIGRLLELPHMSSHTSPQRLLTGNPGDKVRLAALPLVFRHSLAERGRVRWAAGLRSL